MTSRFDFDPLTGAPVLLAPLRARRPNAFSERDSVARCPFCPGNESDTPPEIERSAGSDGSWELRIFPNLYPATGPGGNAAGAHEVIVDSPLHEVHPADLTEPGFGRLFEAYARRVEHHLSRGCEYVVVFKNEGARAGESLEHVHTQLIAFEAAPPPVATAHDGDCSVCEASPNAVFRSDDAFAFVPRVSRLPYEIVVASTRHAGSGLEAAGAIIALAVPALEALRALRAITGDAPFNWFIVVEPESRHAVLTIAPRLTAIAGFELATGIMINIVDPASAESSYREFFEKKRAGE